MRKFLIVACVVALCGFGIAFGVAEDKQKPIGIPVTVSGTTNASGLFTYNFPNAYVVAPNVQASIANQANTNMQIRVQSVTASSVTLHVYQRSAVTLLGVEVLLAATTNVSGAQVDLLLTQKI